VRTRLSVCARKARYRSMEAALLAANKSGWDLYPYRCDRGAHFHLTSRRRGKFVRKAKVPSSNSG
jgi:hypothetical protein